MADYNSQYTGEQIDEAVGGVITDPFLPLAPEAHRTIFRGKNLGTSLTSAQRAEIQAGTFGDLYLGDYWVINGVTWRIADFDYWYRCGDTSFTNHHLVIIPDTALYTAPMNAENTTDGGYTGSQMYTEGLAEAKTAFQNAFGDALLTHREYLVNAVTDGRPSAGAWYDSTVELPNEIMIYGCHIYAPANDGSTIPMRYTIDNSQLALMQACPKFIKTRYTYWLRDGISAATFASVGYGGRADYYYAMNSSGVRPVAAIG